MKSLHLMLPLVCKLTRTWIVFWQELHSTTATTTTTNLESGVSQPGITQLQQAASLDLLACDGCCQLYVVAFVATQ